MEGSCHASRNRSSVPATRRSAPRPDSKSRSLHAVPSSVASTKPLRRARLRLRSAVKERLEHPAPGSLAVVVAEHVLVHVGLQVLRGYAVVHAANSAPQERPETFNRVRVNLARDVDAPGVVHPLVGVPALAHL